MGFIASVFLSTVLNSFVLTLVLTDTNIVSTTIYNSPPSPQGNLDANHTVRPDVLEGANEAEAREILSKKDSIRNNREDGGKDSEDRAFAVFVDSPDESDESSDGSNRDDSVRQHKGSETNDKDGNVDDDMVDETRMKHVISNKFRNGSVIHDIRIAVKHPQNMKRKRPSNGKKKNKKSGLKRTSTQVTSFSTSEAYVGYVSNMELPVTARGNNTNSLQSNSEQTNGELKVDDLTFTILTDEFYSTNLTETLFTHQDNETVTLMDGLTLNSPETDSAIVTINTSARNWNTSGACANIFYLNLTNSDNCVSKCLVKCIISKKSEETNESSGSSETPFNIHKNSSSGVPVGLYYPDNEYHVAEHEDNGERNNTLSTKIYTDQVETTYQTTGAPPNLNEPIGSEIKHNLIGTPEMKQSDVPFLLEDICLSKTCVLKAAELLKRMNQSVDPCRNFYEFSCGGFLKREIPNDDLLWSVFAEIGSDIVFRMISVLREPAGTSEPNHVIVLKHLFNKCREMPPGVLLMEVLQELGGWPAPKNRSWTVPFANWQEIAFNWTYGAFVEYNFVMLDISYFNKTGEWILNLDLPVFVKLALRSKSLGVLKQMERETAAIALSLGVDNDTVFDSIEVLHLFMEYAVNYANDTQMNKQEAFHTLGQLKKMFPYLNLLKNLPSLLETSISIDDDEVIFVSDVVYMQKINTLIRDTPVRTQTALLVISATRELYHLIAASKAASMARYCVKFAWQLFPNIMENIYAANFMDDSTVNGVLTILSQVKNRLEKTLKESSLENETKIEAMQRLNFLSFVVSNRVDRGFDQIGFAELGDLSNSSFASIVRVGIWHFKQSAYKSLHQDYNSSAPKLIEKYLGDHYRVNSFSVGTYVYIPLSLMHQNIYDDALPYYVNFAGVGMILGHEMVHGVAVEESLRNSSRYRSVELCLIEQFDDFTERYLGLPIDGRVTKNENVADLGGFREAYLAYKEWTGNRPEKELKLPGLHRFNNRQMFWLTAASNWCQVASRKAMVLVLQQDNHAPSENRINGQLANLPEFSRDFHCPHDSPMNPRNKCSLW